MVFSLEKFKYIYDFNSFENKQFILAAISLPRFKLNWMPEFPIYRKIQRTIFARTS